MAEPDAARPFLIPGDPGADRHWLAAAIELSRRCPPSEAAFSVGAIIISEAGQVLATGYSRELHPKDHAEEVTLRRLSERAAGSGALTCADSSAAPPRAPASVTGAELGRATLYSSLEPCIARASAPVTCAELIATAGIRRVVIAWREPPVFVPGGGAAWLTARGVTVVDIPDLADEARAVNSRLLA